MKLNEETINGIIGELGLSENANLIKAALSKDANKVQVDRDFEVMQNKSEERFIKIKEKYESEERIYNNAHNQNAEAVLRKNIKVIGKKLKDLGF